MYKWIFVLAFLIYFPNGFLHASVEVRLLVKDESGKPISGAEAQVVYEGYQERYSVTKTVITDLVGMAKVTGQPIQMHPLASIRVRIAKEGYYQTRFKDLDPLMDIDPTKAVHQLDVVLRAIGNPVPMSARKVEIEFPALDQEFGFDFQIGDWVKPHGKGENADCLCIASKRVGLYPNYETKVRMRFVGANTGLLKDPFTEFPWAHLSEFQTSRIAPESGYVSEWEFVLKRTEDGREGSTEETDYLMRIRAKQDATGTLATCHYGKMREAVNVSQGSSIAEQKPMMIFTSYFNPTPNDRNLEFDPKRNLFRENGYTQPYFTP